MPLSEPLTRLTDVKIEWLGDSGIYETVDNGCVVIAGKSGKAKVSLFRRDAILAPDTKEFVRWDRPRPVDVMSNTTFEEYNDGTITLLGASLRNERNFGVRASSAEVKLTPGKGCKGCS